MVKLTFFGAVREIGGNKILLEDGDTRLFLDFGKSFGLMNEYYGGYLTPRSVNGIGDYLEFDILPRLEGLYKPDMIEGIMEYCEPNINGVLISHPHIDHIGFLSFLDPKIPVYCGEIARFIIEAIEDSTAGSNFGDHDFRTFHTGDRLKIGSLEVEPIHVDHSTPGAYGYIIHTSIGPIVYTGDLRVHGTRSDMTRDFVRRAKEVKPRILITEATRVMPQDTRKNFTESEVREETTRIVSRTDKLVIVSFYGRDLDRFKSIYAVAKECGRKFVVSMRLACLLNKVREDARFEIPDIMNDDVVLVYKRRKKSGEYDEKDYQKWERIFLDRAVNSEYVRQNASKVIFNLDLFSFPELIDIQPEPGSHFIHSMSEPFSEDDINDELMHKWIDHFKLDFHQVHASGHCAGEEIKEMAREINPRTLIPIHTEYPELFRGIISDTMMVEKGKQYIFKE